MSDTLRGREVLVVGGSGGTGAMAEASIAAGKYDRYLGEGRSAFAAAPSTLLAQFAFSSNPIIASPVNWHHALGAQEHGASGAAVQRQVISDKAKLVECEQHHRFQAEAQR